MEYRGASLYIVNKLGNEIYRQVEIDDRWDGTYRGKLVPSGIYLYFIEFEDQVRFNNRSGVINVLR
jgi:gliding motility-associated-like protein